MSVRRPLWVQRLAFDIYSITDPVGAARVQLGRSALSEAGLDPVPQPGRDAPASLSASGVAPGPPSQQATDLVPGLSGRAQLALFAAIFFGPTLGWALGVIFGVTL